MMFRDWQFRRQLIPMIPTAVMGLLAIFGGVRTSPFSGTFTPVHFLPHALHQSAATASRAFAWDETQPMAHLESLAGQLG